MHRIRKTILPLLLAVVMALSTVISASAATKSPTTTALKSAKVAKTSVVYNTKKQKPKVTVYDANGKKVPSSGYTIKYTRNRSVGTANITINGKGAYTGKVVAHFKITKAKQTLFKVKLKGKTTVKVNRYEVTRLKKVLGYVRYAGHHGTLKYKSNYKKIKVSKTGKVTVLKGAKKGTYKITVRSINSWNYKNAKKVITIKIK